MKKVSAHDVIEINTLMLKTIASYINCFVKPGGDLTLYADDIAYNANALVRFNKTKNTEALHNAIMQQDTLVREYFIDALRYLEDEDLVDERCCY